MSGRRIIEQTASYSQVKLSGDCISVLFIRLCPANEHYRDLTDSAELGTMGTCSDVVNEKQGV